MQIALNCHKLQYDAHKHYKKKLLVGQGLPRPQLFLDRIKQKLIQITSKESWLCWTVSLECYKGMN